MALFVRISALKCLAFYAFLVLVLILVRDVQHAVNSTDNMKNQLTATSFNTLP